MDYDELLKEVFGDTVVETLTDKQKINRYYYNKNKPILQLKYKSIEKCILCDRKVTHGALRIHQNNGLCRRGQEIKKQFNLINNIKEEEPADLIDITHL